MSVERYLEKLERSNQYKIADIVDIDLFKHCISHIHL